MNRWTYSGRTVAMPETPLERSMRLSRERSLEKLSQIKINGSSAMIAPEEKIDNDNWYLLELKNIDEKIPILAQAGIPCHDVRQQYRIDAIAFPANYLPSVFNCLNIDNREYTLSPTTVEHTFIMKMQDENGPLFKRPENNFEGWTDLLPVMESIKEEYGLRIVPDNPHGEPRSPIPEVDENQLYVHFWSTPVKTKSYDMKRACGIPLVGSQKDGLLASEVGTKISDDEGIVVAEYVPGNLYILFDLPHSHGESVTEMFSRIMRKYLAFRGKAEGEAVNFYENLRGRLNVSSRDQFVKNCSKLYEKNLEDMEASAKAYNLQIDEYNSKLVETMRQRDILMVKLEPLKTSIEERRKWADTEFDTLKSTPLVKDVLVTGKVIHVFTEMIVIKHEGESYNIGEFKIDIDTDGKNSSVRAYNLTRSRANALAHPHVKIDGECCLGNIQSGVSQLLSQYQYVVLAQLMITYLQSYNPDSAYGRVTLWK